LESGEACCSSDISLGLLILSIGQSIGGVDCEGQLLCAGSGSHRTRQLLFDSGALEDVIGVNMG